MRKKYGILNAYILPYRIYNCSEQLTLPAFWEVCILAGNVHRGRFCVHSMTGATEVLNGEPPDVSECACRRSDRHTCAVGPMKKERSALLKHLEELSCHRITEPHFGRF